MASKPQPTNPAKHHNPAVLFVKKLAPQISQDNLIVIYKLLSDLLFLSLLFFALSLIAEGILPGIITSHIGFSKIIIFIFILLAVYYFLGREIAKGAELKNISAKKNKKTVIVLFLLSALLIFNIQLKLNLYLNIFVTLAVILTGYFIYKMMLEE